MNEQNYSIYTILETIRKRPGFYIGNICLENLDVYLSGYRIAMRDAGFKDISSPRFYDFHEFIREKYNFYEPTAGWSNMILAVTIGVIPQHIRWENFDTNVSYGQHEKAVINFFNLLDEFRKT